MFNFFFSKRTFSQKITFIKKDNFEKYKNYIKLLKNYNNRSLSNLNIIFKHSTFCIENS